MIWARRVLWVLAGVLCASLTSRSAVAASVPPIVIHLEHPADEEIGQVCVLTNRGGKENDIANIPKNDKKFDHLRAWLSNNPKSEGYFACSQKKGGSWVLLRLRAVGKFAGIDLLRKRGSSYELMIEKAGRVVRLGPRANLSSAALTVEILGGDYVSDEVEVGGAQGRVVLELRREFKEHAVELPAGFFGTKALGMVRACLCQGRDCKEIYVGDGPPAELELAYQPNPAMRTVWLTGVLSDEDPPKCDVVGTLEGREEEANAWFASYEWEAPRAPQSLHLGLNQAPFRWRREKSALRKCPKEATLRNGGHRCVSNQGVLSEEERDQICHYSCRAQRRTTITLPSIVDLTIDSDSGFPRRFSSLREEPSGFPRGREIIHIRFEPFARWHSERAKVKAEGRTEAKKKDKAVKLTQGWWATADAVALRGPDGSWRRYALDSTFAADGRNLPLPGVRCGDSFVYTYDGEREFRTETIRVESCPQSAGKTLPNTVELRSPGRMVREFGFLVGAGAGIIGPQATFGGRRSRPIDGVAGRFEFAAHFWPRGLRQLSFEVAATALLAQGRSYFPISSDGQPGAPAHSDEFWRTGLEPAVVFRHKSFKRVFALDLGFGLGASFPAFLSDQNLVGGPRFVPWVFGSVRLLNAPHAVVLIRAGVLVNERIYGLHTDFRGETWSEDRPAIAGFGALTLRLDVTRLPFLGARVQRSIEGFKPLAQ